MLAQHNFIRHIELAFVFPPCTSVEVKNSSARKRRLKMMELIEECGARS